jgi:hypothetical protein
MSEVDPLSGDLELISGDDLPALRLTVTDAENNTAPRS